MQKDLEKKSSKEKILDETPSFTKPVWGNLDRSEKGTFYIAPVKKNIYLL